MLLGLTLSASATVAEIVRSWHPGDRQGPARGSPGAWPVVARAPCALSSCRKHSGSSCRRLTNIYVTTFKNSSLAIAIGYPDLVMVSNTIMNQTGQAMEPIALFMLVYLGLSLATSLLMNWYNARVALQGR